MKKQRIVIFGNNWVAWKLVEWLHSQNENIVGLVVHPDKKARYRDEIIHASGLSEGSVVVATKDVRKSLAHYVRLWRPDICFSIFYDYILSREFVGVFPYGIVNVHPSYLPYNRGQYPNVWSIVDGTPSGVTLHYIDEGIDTGDVIAQEKVEIEAVDTGKTLYNKLELGCIDLFKRTWPLIKSGSVRRISQENLRGTCHRADDVRCIDEIDLNKYYKASDLIDLIRARTFSPYSGAYYMKDGKRIYVRMELMHEDQL